MTARAFEKPPTPGPVYENQKMFEYLLMFPTVNPGPMSMSAHCLKLSRPVLAGFLRLCFGPSPVFALHSGLKDFELGLNWEKELPNVQGFLATVVPFLALGVLSVWLFGAQRGIFRSYAREDSEVACPRGLIFPPMVEANPHTNIDPPRRNDHGRGGAASRVKPKPISSRSFSSSVRAGT